MKIDCFVSVVAPLQNDADIVASYIRDTVPLLRDNYTNYELVLIDDGSRDETTSVTTGLLTEYEGIRLLRLSREFGEEVAISAGLDTVIGDFTIVMLPRMDPPALIPELVNRCMEGTDVVFGVRRTRSGESWLIRKAAAFFYWYCRKLLKLDLPQNSTQFRCLSRQAVNAITQIKDSYRYLRLFSSYVGYERQQFHYDPINRGGKYRPRSFFQSVNQAIALIIENSSHPLRLVSWLGLLAAAGNLAYVVYIFGIYILKEDVSEGWTTLSLQNAGQFFLIALILTALCEYTGRMLNRLQDRPLYYLMEERNSSVLLVDQERRNIVEESRPVDLESSKETAMMAAAPLDHQPEDWKVPDCQVQEYSEKRHRYCVCVFVINEGEKIRKQLGAMEPFSKLLDIIIADGGSTDGSLEPDFLQTNGVRTLLIKTGPGKLSAQMRMAFAYALMQGYEGIITIDGNNKDDPIALPRFVNALDEGYDHIQGSRFVADGEAINTPWQRLLAVRLLHAPLISLSSGFHYTDTTNGFRGYSRRLLLDPRVAPFRDVFVAYELHYYLAIRAARLGFTLSEVPVTRRYPAHGKTPTKISPLRGNLLIFATLFKACLRRYDPNNQTGQQI